MVKAVKTEEEKKVEKLLKDLKKLGVEVAGTETVEQLEAMLAEAKAKAEADKPKKEEKNSTTFVFKNGGTRVFSESVHGEGWEALADEFAETNKAIIANRDGEVA